MFKSPCHGRRGLRSSVRGSRARPAAPVRRIAVGAQGLDISTDEDDYRPATTGTGTEWLQKMKDEFGPISSAPAATAVLDFEKPLVELDRRIREVRQVAEENDVDVSDQIKELQTRAIQLREDTYSRLTPSQRLQVARHPSRPTFLDIAYNISDKFVELHGDRAGLDDAAVVCGLAAIGGVSYMLVGQQKGRNTKENIQRNFAMPQPNGYRKAMRFMRYADKFGMPIITFVDTPGAFAGRTAEELGQGEAIAYNLREMFGLRVPVISVVIGEGGSGGALAIGCANRNLILENAVYYVASPEACAAILWKSRDETATATEALKVTSHDLHQFGIMDRVIPEPLGGAHRDPMATFPRIKQAIMETYKEYSVMSECEIKKDRYNKFRKIGHYRDFLVKGGRVAEAEERREQAQGMLTKTGRWAENEHEKEYWDIYDDLTEKWEAALEKGKEWTHPPEDLYPGEALQFTDGSEHSKLRSPKTTEEALQAAQAAADAVAANGAGEGSAKQSSAA